MSNGKKWRDAKKVHRDKHRGLSRLIGGKMAKTTGNKWWFRAQIKNNSFGNTSMKTMKIVQRKSVFQKWPN